MKLSALIIEDESYLATIFAKALHQAGFDVQTAVDGRDGQAKLSQTSPAVVALDLHLPFVSGADLLRYIRTADHLRHTQVVIISADAVLSGWLHDQADFALTKPISFHELVNLGTRLRQALD